MDPKMDSGALADGESFEDEFDVSRELLPEEVVGLMDQILCHEMAWHMGHPLSQTLFTSYHIDRLLSPEPKTLGEAQFNRQNIPEPQSNILHTVFRAYCLAVIKFCYFVHQKIGNEHYYEEEDFVSNLYNRNLLAEFETTQIQQLLNEALMLAREHPSINESTRNAIAVRLILRQRLVKAAEFDLDPDKTARIWDWRQCTELVPELQKTHRIGKPVTEAFSVKIQRRLASSVPPRPMVCINSEDAFPFLSRLCRDAADAHHILDYNGTSNILNFTYIIQSRKPQPAIYVRCLLQSLIFHDMKVLGKITITKLIFDDLAEIVLPSDILLDPANGNVEAPHDPRFQIAKEMRDWVLRVGDPFLDIFRALCMNRSRMRRLLCHLTSDWETVQIEAEDLDTELRKYTGEKPLTEAGPKSAEIWSFPLSSWAYNYKLRQMEWIIQLGFELEVYQVDELSAMYWYLSHVVGARVQHLERIQTFVSRRFRQSKKLSTNQRKSFKSCFSFLDVALLEASATQCFATSLSKLYTILLFSDIVTNRPQPLPYSSFELRHALRMRPFLQLSIPELPSHAELKAATSITTADTATNDTSSTEQSLLTTLEFAEKAAKAARKEWEALSKLDAETARCVSCEEWWRDSMKNMVRACIACNIALVTVRKGVQKAKGKPLGEVLRAEMPESGKGYHDFWIVPKLFIQ
ncbi:MAG: hypothetical protein Q9222_003442 [Ikaeria aurantiellina]